MGESVLIEVALSTAAEVCEIITSETKKQLINVFQKFIDNRISFQKAREIVVQLVGNPAPIEKLREIISVPETPLPAIDNDDSDGTGTKRKKTRTWTIEEDNRLLMGVYKFGYENWNSIAIFVGHSRNRSQCSQRWLRVLNPHISKAPWSEEENKKLLDLIKRYGTKMWVKISSEMNRRTDVQCRYRYKQLMGSADLSDSSAQTQSSSKSTKPTTPKMDISRQKQPPQDITNLSKPPMIPQQVQFAEIPQSISKISPPQISQPQIIQQAVPNISSPLQQQPIIQPTIYAQQPAAPIIALQTGYPPQRHPTMGQTVLQPAPAMPGQIQIIPSYPPPAQAAIPGQQRAIPAISSLQIPLARTANQPSQSNFEAPLLLKSSGDFFKSDQLFDSSFWT